MHVYQSYTHVTDNMRNMISVADPHWSYADPDPQNLVNADPDP